MTTSWRTFQFFGFSTVLTYLAYFNCDIWGQKFASSDADKSSLFHKPQVINGRPVTSVLHLWLLFWENRNFSVLLVMYSILESRLVPSWSCPDRFNELCSSVPFIYADIPALYPNKLQNLRSNPVHLYLKHADFNKGFWDWQFSYFVAPTLIFSTDVLRLGMFIMWPSRDPWPPHDWGIFVFIYSRKVTAQCRFQLKEVCVSAPVCSNAIHQAASFAKSWSISMFNVDETPVTHETRGNKNSVQRLSVVLRVVNRHRKWIWSVVVIHQRVQVHAYWG